MTASHCVRLAVGWWQLSIQNVFAGLQLKGQLPTRLQHTAVHKLICIDYKLRVPGALCQGTEGAENHSTKG